VHGKQGTSFKLSDLSSGSKEAEKTQTSNEVEFHWMVVIVLQKAF
jgi:hypothetical protein